MLLNGRAVFQRLVLDQGFYPDGILTAPSDEALLQDIELSMAAGFNGARLHQKVFEERFLYHADRLGYLVWGEFPDLGCARVTAQPKTTSSPPPPTSPSGWRPSSAITRTRPSSAGARSTRPGRRITDRITAAGRRSPGACSWRPSPGHHPPGAGHLRLLAPRAGATFTTATTTSKTRPNSATHDGAMPGKTVCQPWPADQREFSIPYHGQPYLRQRVWRDLVEPERQAQGEDSWGYGERVAESGRVVRALRRAVRRPAGQLAHVWLLLHPADRCLPGAKRYLLLRPF